MSRKLISVGIILVFFALGAFLFNKHTLVKSGRSSPTPTSSDYSNYKRADINKDGIVDEIDRNMIQKHLGCKNTDKCWNERIGKTQRGDNPIYTYNLDLNSDGVIDKGDLDEFSKNE